MVFKGFLILSWEFSKPTLSSEDHALKVLCYFSLLSLSLFGLFLGLSSFDVFLFLLGFLGHHVSYIVC
jgi:hypothetical protein